MLTKPEIAAIWKACDELGPHDVAKNYGRMVRFLLLTAQRRDEAASLTFGDILDGAWRQAENKASRPHSLPLPPLAQDTGRAGRGARLRFRRPPRQDRRRSRKLKGLLDEASGVTDWRLHDLRRTAASNMQELGIRNEVVQAVLNHAVPGVGGVYLRSRTRKAEGRRAGDMGHGAHPHRRAGAGDGMTVRKKVKKTASKTVSDNARLLEVGRRLAATHARLSSPYAGKVWRQGFKPPAAGGRRTLQAIFLYRLRVRIPLMEADMIVGNPTLACRGERTRPG